MLLKRGSTGNAVAIVQYALNGVTAFAPKLKVDGIFGPKTDERVRQHQSRQRLQPDGIVGPLTLDSLFEIMTLRARSTFKRNDGARSALPTGLRLQPPLGSSPSPASNWLSPAMAEFMRQQQAFWHWWSQPQPKPQLPRPNTVIVPIPGPWGPVYLPAAHQQIVVPGPPAKIAQARTAVPAEGGAFTLSIKGEAETDVAKLKFKEAEYGVGLDWAVLKGRVAEIEIGASVAQNHEGEISGEVEVTLTGGSGLTLKTKLGQLGVLKFVPYLATSVTSEIAFKASGGVKAVAEIDITRVGPFAIKANVGVKGGPKLQYGPVRLPDGREEHQWTATPMGATGFVSIVGEF
jgi:peptidoglycan hydrolase-like protein with peptidoglycan-binding domain